MSSRNKNGALRFPFIAVWEFRVRPGRRRVFEKTYGPEGAWADLFRRDRGYLGTELVRDRERPLRYLTLDFWTSRQAYRRFLKQNRAAYQQLNRRCELLTARERLIGEFDHVGGMSACARSGNGAAPSSALTLRSAVGADIPAMMALEGNLVSAARWSEATYRGIFEQGCREPIACALEDPSAGVRAFLIAHVMDDDCELENIVVAPELQSRGWGTKLVEELISRAASRGAKRIYLEVRESSRPARALYEKCGFVVAGRRRSYYQNPSEDALLYRLEL
jgi:ribosomal-protein-alanine N-acetyltransferase